MREAEITESGGVIGGRSISNLRYADDTALCGKSPQEINNIVHKVNDAGRIRLLKLNARKTKLMVVGDENANVSIDVNGETIDKVNAFKYLGAIKTSMGSCSEDVKARIGRAKKATMELDIIWKDRGIRKELKMKLVKALIWPVITYGAEGWTLNLHGHDHRLFWSCLSRFKLSLPQCNVPVVFNGMSGRLSGFPSIY